MQQWPFKLISVAICLWSDQYESWVNLPGLHDYEQANVYQEWI